MALKTVTLEAGIFINRPRQDVWDFFSDPANNNKWESSTEYAEWTSEGSPDVGSTYRAVGKLLGRKVEFISEITVWDPPNEHGHKSTSGPVPLDVTIKFEPEENGTQLNAQIAGEFGVIFRMFIKMLKKQLDASFETLKLLLEEGQT